METKVFSFKVSKLPLSFSYSRLWLTGIFNSAKRVSRVLQQFRRIFSLTDFNSERSENLLLHYKWLTKGEPVIRELYSCHFFLFDGKLLYACEDFVGYDPAISKPLVRVRPKLEGTEITEDAFRMNRKLFRVQITEHIQFAILRGYSRIKITQGRTPIISYQTPGFDAYITKFKSNVYLFKDDNAFSVCSGGDLRDFKTNKIYLGLDPDPYYFFWFKAVFIPTEDKAPFKYYSFVEKGSNTIKRVVPPKQYFWHVKCHINNYELNISKRLVPGSFDSRIRILVDGIDYLNEKKVKITLTSLLRLLFLLWKLLLLRIRSIMHASFIL